MEMDNIESMKYKELQKLAKRVGIKANGSKGDIISALRATLAGDTSEEEESPRLEPQPLDNNLNDDVDEKKDKPIEEQELEIPLNRTFDKDDTLETLDQSNDNSRFVEFTAENEKTPRRSTRISKEIKTPRDYLSKKNNTPLRRTLKTPGSIMKAKPTVNKKSSEEETQIPKPRFVKYAQKGRAGKMPNFSKMHDKVFEKMDSLDTYVEKRTDRKAKLVRTPITGKKTEGRPGVAETVAQQLDRAKAAAEKHTAFVASLKSKKKQQAPSFIPTVTSISKINLNFGTENSTEASQELFKFSAKPKAAIAKVVPKQRKDLKSSTKLKSPKLKESKAAPKPLENITNQSAVIATPGRKFDLVASLAKPLPYQPHKGKLKALEKKRKPAFPSSSLEPGSQAEVKQRQLEVIKGVRLNKRAELLMRRRKVSS